MPGHGGAPGPCDLAVGSVAMTGDVLWKGATVLDGSGEDPYEADVVTGPGGGIESVHRGGGTAASGGLTVVDCAGLCIAPGFVDLHSHSDLYSALPEDEPGGVPLGDSPKLLQGCTAQVFGQDGLSAAPVDEGHLEDHMSLLAGLDGTIPRAAWTWRSFSSYLARLREVSRTRSFGLVGHSTIRRHVMGYEAREPSEAELAQMQTVLATALDEGAAGLSSGLVYIPAAYSTTAEVAALCEVAASRHKPFFVHVRSEGDRVEEATDEVIEVCARTGCHLHYSHIKAAGQTNWHKAGSLLDKLEAARGGGVDISADVHPYTAGATTASVLCPPWMFEGGGVEAALERLGDPSARARARRELLGEASFDNWLKFSGGWRGLKVASASDPAVVGKSFAEVIWSAGVDDLESEGAFEVVFDLLASERLSMSLISFNNVEENVARFIAEPYCSVGTDAVVNPNGHPHPRLYGTFPRVLARFVRELGTLSLPEAVAKMTSRAASVIGAGDRLGRIVPGFAADLVCFDPAAVSDEATYESPRQLPKGIEHVVVGGRFAVRDGRLLGDSP